MLRKLAKDSAPLTAVIASVLSLSPAALPLGVTASACAWAALGAWAGWIALNYLDQTTKA